MLKRIESPEALEQAFAAERFLLFKHSPTCPVSAAAWEEYERFLSDHPQLDSGWIQVIRERDLSQAVAARTGVRHESPQALLLVRGQPVWNASHTAITAASLERALTLARAASSS